jgi:hypothetical protein
MGRAVAKQLKGETSMASREKLPDEPPELKAVSTIYSALKTLDRPIQIRAIRFVAEMLGLDLAALSRREHSFEPHEDRLGTPDTQISAPPLPAEESADDEVEGINAVALKWMKRSGLDPRGLQTLFSLGIDEIDLVAQSVPGRSKRERMRSVVLLKAIAAYLSAGVPRTSYEQLKQACLHYNAFDATNFATYLKSFAAEVGGGKETGYTLTPRGLAAATDLIKEILASKG